MSDNISIALPSLIHRIGREPVKHAQLIAKQYRCELKRVRRSRNWALTGVPMAVQQFSAELKQVCLTSPQNNTADNLTLSPQKLTYLIQKVDTALLGHADKLEPLAAKLVRLITANPNITLAELMHLTDCSLSEARAARFDADSW
ncbi:ribosome recycling factor family protein [Shewanella pneumatophori]|uniref:Ribosome recycling factor family protein n=1 Tax=Shewanella pneumatophori TaxID=314092 RepID=A0A9X2CDE1_9GAMM|nr:ribosome recycling factor family protein [Shewanella pneumatophori]MCL1137867.1 ribosome recycling factor family protein [Shewanella pneumatophori]